MVPCKQGLELRSSGVLPTAFAAAQDPRAHRASLDPRAYVVQMAPAVRPRITDMARNGVTRQVVTCHAQAYCACACCRCQDHALAACCSVDRACRSLPVRLAWMSGTALCS